MRVTCACLMVAVAAFGGAAARADFIGGTLTADVALSVPGLNGGNPFPAVINPDYIMDLTVNVTGSLTGSLADPTAFGYAALPVYAIVPHQADLVTSLPAPFIAWAYSDPLFTGVSHDLVDRDFSLALVGELTLVLQRAGVGQYGVASGTFRDVVNDVLHDLAGEVDFPVPPWGPPDFNFAWYDVGYVDLSSSTGVAIGLNDGAWTDGWPGATLDKNFFPTPEPATLSLLAAGGLGALLRRRRR